MKSKLVDKSVLDMLICCSFEHEYSLTHIQGLVDEISHALSSARELCLIPSVVLALSLVAMLFLLVASVIQTCAFGTGELAALHLSGAVKTNGNGHSRRLLQEKGGPR